MSNREDPLAYGNYYGNESSRGGGGESARGFVGDTFKLLKETYKSHHSRPQGENQPPGQGPAQGNQGSYGVSDCIFTDYSMESRTHLDWGIETLTVTSLRVTSTSRRRSRKIGRAHV